MFGGFLGEKSSPILEGGVTSVDFCLFFGGLNKKYLFQKFQEGGFFEWCLVFCFFGFLTTCFGWLVAWCPMAEENIRRKE